MDAAAQKQVIIRLRRARGQIDGIIAMIEEGRACRDVVTQLAAASAALNKAGYKLIATSMQECLLDPSANPETTPRELEELFIRLA